MFRDPLEPGWAQYTAIIDHADSTPNFERPGRTPYLYYTRFNEGGGLDRDLVRVPLKFTMGGPLCDGVDCDDQSECTEDLCNGADGSCEHTPIECADSNDCTVDTCNPTIGCEYRCCRQWHAVRRMDRGPAKMEAALLSSHARSKGFSTRSHSAAERILSIVRLRRAS